MRAPGLVVAAARSGSGKTVLTLGLMRALGRRGLRVVGRKNGPDYIDPAFHAAVTGRPSANLDSWAMPDALLRRLAADEDADLVLCEGSMGLFDGVHGPPGRTGSSADIAALTGWPVVLVHDCSGQSQTAAALLRGMAAFDRRIHVAGVILNRVASERHRRLVAEAVEAAGLRVLGAVPRTDRLAMPERHLGLVQAGETADLEARVDAAADVMAEYVDLDAVMAVAGKGAVLLPLKGEAGSGEARDGWGSAGRGSVDRQLSGRTERREPSREPHPSPLRVAAFLWKGKQDQGSADRTVTPHPSASRTPSPRRGEGSLSPPGRRVAVARDAAFSFLYPHVLDGWRRAGADLVFFSPLADEPPDPACDAVWLPGGYPELHAGRIASADRFLTGLRAVAATRPVHGECGGYMVLGRSLADASGTNHAMAGLLDVATSFAQRKLHLGYRDAKLLSDGPLGPAGTRLRGHEFHYATVTDPGEDPAFAEVVDAHGAGPSLAGSRRGNVTGSFFHALAAVNAP